MELICNKLYRDEISSVFYANNIYDDKIHIGMNYVLEKLLENNHLKTILEEIKSKCFFYINNDNNLTLDEENIYKIQNNSNFFIILILFSYDIFYITHKVLVELLTTTNVSNDLLVLLKNSAIETLINKNH